MDENLKRLAWLSTGGLAIGELVRHANDALRGLPDLSDSPLTDLSSLMFGMSFVALWLLMMLTLLAFNERRPLSEARDHYARSGLTGGTFSRRAFIVFRAINTFFAYLAGYFIAAFISLQALAGDPLYGIKLFGYWCLTFAIGLYSTRAREKGKLAKEPDTLERNVVRMLGLPDLEGGFVVITLLIALFAGYGLYDHVAQSFGGGKPENAILIFRQHLPGSSDIDGKPVQIMFRRGSRIGIRTEGMKKDQFVIVDLAEVERIYVGKAVKDPSLPK